MVDARLSPDGRTLTVRVPLSFQRRGGRKLVVAPDGSKTAPALWAQTATALVKALANVHRWQRMLDGGDYATVSEWASAEKLNSSYVSRVLRLTLLAPDIVEAILDGRRAVTLRLGRLPRPAPVEWDEQRQVFRTT
jgi:hypothetical protein